MKMDKKDKKIKFLTIALIILTICFLGLLNTHIQFKRDISDHFGYTEKCDQKCSELHYFSMQFGYAENGSAICICALPDGKNTKDFIRVDIYD